MSVVYDSESSFILDLINSLEGDRIIDSFNIDHYKEKRRAISIMNRHGTKNVPLVVFKDNNFEEIDAIWSESNPDWELELKKRFNKN